MTVLDAVKKRLSPAPNAQLVEEIAARREELRTLRRAHVRFRDVAHREVEWSIQAARSELQAEFARAASMPGALRPDRVRPTLAGPSSAESPLERLGSLWAVTSDPAFADAWHAAIDAADGFSPLSSEQFEQECGKLEDEIRERRVELERRRLTAAQEKLGEQIGRLGEGEFAERGRSGRVDVFDADGAYVGTYDEPGLIRWQGSVSRAAGYEKHNAEQDRVAYVAPTYTIVPLDGDQEPIDELADTWIPFSVRDDG